MATTLLAGVIALLFVVILLSMGVRSRGRFGHGGTLIDGPVWFIILVIAILLIAGGQLSG